MGFNIDLACALGKCTQILALGGMGPHIVPFVFSYAAGGIPTWFETKRMFPKYGADLASMLTDLGKHFADVHILCHSSGAEFFFANFEMFESCFAPSRHRRKSWRWQRLTAAAGTNGRSGKLQLATLTMMNPDVLFEKVAAKLPRVMDYAEHFTTYNDESDNALFGSMVAQKIAPDCFQRGIRVADTTCKTVVFGAVSQSLYLEVVPGPGEDGDERVVLRGRAMEIAEGQPSVAPAAPAGHRSGSIHGIEDDNQGHDYGDIDVIDTSSLDQNVSNIRHSYYMLNTQMVEDVCDVIGRRSTARTRTRLVQVRANVYKFLSPPSYVMGD